MLSAPECRKEANNCRVAAARSRGQGDRTVLLRLAVQWDTMAAERDPTSQPPRNL